MVHSYHQFLMVQLQQLLLKRILNFKKLFTQADILTIYFTKM